MHNFVNPGANSNKLNTHMTFNYLHSGAINKKINFKQNNSQAQQSILISSEKKLSFEDSSSKIIKDLGLVDDPDIIETDYLLRAFPSKTTNK